MSRAQAEGEVACDRLLSIWLNLALFPQVLCSPWSSEKLYELIIQIA